MAKILEMIDRELYKQRMPRTVLSRKLNLHNTTVQAMFNGKSLKVHRLIAISKALDYNFFSEISEQLSVKDPFKENRLRLKDEEYKDQIDKLNADIEHLRQENKTLQVKFELLEKVIDTLGN